jgi:hypothetical protein
LVLVLVVKKGEIKMSKLRFLTVCMFLVSTFSWAEPVSVYDINVQPDSPNKKVTVSYRLAETASGLAYVDVEISSDAGTTWSVPANTFYPGSDVGDGVRADASQRQFVWDARADWNQQYSTQMVVRLRAESSEQQDAIYFANKSVIYRMNLDGSGWEQVWTGTVALAGGSMTADMDNGRLFIAPWDSSAIHVYDVLRNGMTTLAGPGSGGQGIGYCPVADKLFAGRYYSGLYSMDMSNQGAWRQIVSSSAISPLNGQRGQLRVDPVNEHVYFRTAYNGTCDNCWKIYRVDYDGSNLTTIVSSRGDALGLDLTNGKLYYSDAAAEPESIMRCNLDGTSAEVVLALTEEYKACRWIELDVDRSKIYMYLFPQMQAPFSSVAFARANMDGTGYEVIREFTGATTSDVDGSMALFLQSATP